VLLKNLLSRLKEMSKQLEMIKWWNNHL